ncbi:unnamed protein product [Aphanomyces euteiches]
MKNAPKPDYFDMDVLNDLWRYDCGYLPSHYVVLTSTLDEDSTFGFATKAERIRKTYIHHFSTVSGLQKPWFAAEFQLRDRDPNFEPLFYDLFDMYWKAGAELCAWL